MVGMILGYGALVGLIHFAVTGALYGNPVIGGMYAAAMGSEPGVKRWRSQARYLLTQFLGTQVEVYIVAVAFVLFRAAVPLKGYAGATVLGFAFAALRVYPRFWNMWIQSTYPNRLLLVELVNGVLSTLTMVWLWQAFLA